jgi:CHAD domain-containing protein
VKPPNTSGTCFSDAQKFGKRSAKNFKKEDVHEWRVSVKKIKATFLFLQFQHPNLENELIKPLKKIYRQSGTIREVQLLKDALEKFRRSKNAPGKENLMDELGKLERKVEKKFQKRFDEAGEDDLKNLKSEMLSVNKKSEKQESVSYFKEKIKSILQLFQKQVFPMMITMIYERN